MEGGRDGGAVGGGGGGGGNPEQEIHPGPIINQENLQTEQQNPLLNELILEKVVKYVGAGALPPARMVNTSWYDASLPFWRELELPIILCLEDDPSDPVPPVWKRHARRDAIPMRDFMRSLETGRGGEEEEEEEEAPVVTRGIKQHTTFELRAQASLRMDPYLLESFWNHFGDWMTKLILWDFFFPCLELVKEVVLCRRTPNLESLDVLITMGEALLKNKRVVEDVQGEHVKLKSLKLGMLPVHGLRSSSGWESEDVTFPFSWDSLLNYFSKLESLTLHTATADNIMEKEVKPCLSAIKAIRSKDARKLASLKSLSWFDEDYLSYKSSYGDFWAPSYGRRLSWDMLDLLRDCNLRGLTSLAMHLPHESSTLGEISDKRRIFEALATYRDTLRQLRLFQWRVVQLEGLLPSDMTRLQYLCIVAHSSDINNMAFLKHVPSTTVQTLKILKLDAITLTTSFLNFISRTQEEDMRGVVLSALKTFCLPEADVDNGCTALGRDYSREDITRLAGWMPNLTRLEMELTNEAFGSICESFPNLEHLRIFGEKVGDKGITGEQVVAEGGGGGQEVVFYQQPNLSSLQKLQSFAINNPPGLSDRNERITEVSVLHGFLKLPSLEKLILNTSWLVTPEAKSLLEEKIHFAKVGIYPRLERTSQVSDSDSSSSSSSSSSSDSNE